MIGCRVDVQKTQSGISFHPRLQSGSSGTDAGCVPFVITLVIQKTVDVRTI